MGWCCCLESLACLVVGLVVVKALWELINPYVIAKLLNVAANVKSFGEWAGEC